MSSPASSELSRGVGNRTSAPSISEQRPSHADCLIPEKVCQVLKTPLYRVRTWLLLLPTPPMHRWEVRACGKTYTRVGILTLRLARRLQRRPEKSVSLRRQEVIQCFWISSLSGRAEFVRCESWRVSIVGSFIPQQRGGCR